MYIKGFDKNLRCRDLQFEVGKTYDTGYTENLKLCSNTVFHFCDSLEKVHDYYDCSDDEENRYCEIEPLGEIVSDCDKMGSNKIRIVREITGEELELLKGHKNDNTGLFNSGFRNIGDFNSGDRNSGDFNSGDRNSGDWNSGNGNTGYGNSGYKNSGNKNSGDFNSGDFNSGDWNSGNWNSGNWNSGSRNGGCWNNGNENIGDWNKCDGSNGVFCTKEPTIKIFDKDTNMTLREFRNSKYYEALTSVHFAITKWIYYTKEEKKEDKNKKLIGGYLKTYSHEEACANWWSAMTKENKEIIMSIPNFDADKFYEITGIRV